MFGSRLELVNLEDDEELGRTLLEDMLAENGEKEWEFCVAFACIYTTWSYLAHASWNDLNLDKSWSGCEVWHLIDFVGKIKGERGGSAEGRGRG